MHKKLMLILLAVYPFTEVYSQTGTWSFLTYAKETLWEGTVLVPMDTVVYIQLSDSVTGSKDFYEFNPNTFAWRKKAPYPGSGYWNLMNFGLDGKVYVGEGMDYYGGEYHDLWMYDPPRDTWIQKNTMYFGYSTGIGYLGKGAPPMILNNKAYVGMQLGKTTYLMEYNPVKDTWIQKSTVPTILYQGVSFTINNRGYTGLGLNNAFYEYNADSNTWHSRSILPIKDYEYPVGFFTSIRGYVGMIDSGNYMGYTQIRRFWEYNPVKDTWAEVGAFPGSLRTNSLAFGLHDKGYLGMGGDAYGDYLNDLWLFDPGISSISEPGLITGELRIYPNPANRLINIEKRGSQTYAGSDYKIMDMMGREIISGFVKQNNNGRSIVDIHTLLPGAYLLEMFSADSPPLKGIIVKTEK